MSEAEATPTTRISRSLIGRLVAVGLFLTVGTLAVVHTVNRRVPQPVDSNGNVADTGGTAADGEATPEPTPDSNSPAGGLAATPTHGTAALKVAVTDQDSQADQDSNNAPPSSGGAAASNPPPLGMATLKPINPNSNPPQLNALLSKPSVPKSESSLDRQPPPIVSGSITVEPEQETEKVDSGSERVAADANRPSGIPPTTFSGNAQPPPIIPGDTAMSLGDTPPSAGRLTASAAPPMLTNTSLGGKSNMPALGTGDTASPSDPPGNPRRNEVAELAADDQTSAAARAAPLKPSVTPYDNPTAATPDSSFAPTANPPEPWPNPPATSTSQGALRAPTLGLNAAPQPSTTANRSALPPTPLRSEPTPSVGTGEFSTQRPLSAEVPRAPMAIPTAARSLPGEAILQGPQNPALKIQKVAPSEVQVGQVADFQIILQNDSNNAINGIVVHDRVPDGAALIASEPTAERMSDGTLVWNIASLAANQSTTIQLKLRADRPGQFGSVAQVTFSALATATTRCTKPVLELQVDSQPQALIGDEVAFDITVRNTGDGPARNVYLQEAVPSGLEFPNGLSQIEYDLGTLAPGDQKQVQLKLKAAKVGMVLNRIVALGDGDLQVSDEAELLIVAPDLQVTADGPSRKYVQREASYQFAVTNRGTAKATNVNLVAALPKGLQFVQANNYGQYDAPSHSVYWSMPDLAASLVGKVELVTLPIQPGNQTIDFRVTADLNQQAATQVATDVEAVVEVACEIDDVEDPIEIGSQTIYNVRVVNEGNHPASQVRLVIDFPPGITPLQVGGGLRSQVQGQRVVFEPISRLDASQETVVSITARGDSSGDHRVVASLATAGRESPISKEESTRVYSDRDAP